MIQQSRQWQAARGHIRGVGLIEVLVAMFILAIGVLGAAALQLNALKFNQTASVRSQGTFLAYEIVDRMRANRDAALAGNYDHTTTPVPTCNSSSTLAAQDLCDWRVALNNRLPKGRGMVQRTGNQFMITIEWDETRNNSIDPDRATTTDWTKQFVFTTDL